MENNLNNLLFITVEDVKESKLWQPINDRKQSAYNDNLIYNAILKTSLWMDRLSGGTISDKINKKDLFPWVKKDNTGLIEYDKWLSYIQSACLLAVINWYLPKGVNDLTGSASFSQGGVAYSQTNDPEANENITRDVKNALKLAGEIIDIISSKTVSRPYNYSLDNYAHPWEEEYKHISKKTFYPTLLFWLKERLQTDNSINITYPTINDFSKIDYNEYIKLIVPFDNNTIYEENGLWKAKQDGDIPSDVIKDSNLNKTYIEKVDGKYIVKTSQDINTKQDKLISGTNIKTINGNSLLGSGDISISNNDWEIVDTSNFVSNSSDTYRIKDYDSNNYIYNISISDQENSVINLTFTTFKNHPIYEFFVPNIIIIRENGLISANNKLTFIHIERKIII
ncbi:hypothetical protein [Spiroplasma endosymbiont of Megaselia nigra]|uniref:hypothetical protein n=1 Tax=Spiroplasma endosymbiont of Megaselia nigra TaxID=2478537 RepID=UPI000F87E96E|nr:hypothetical protein [Spiroplasma endosymbiont of Megaselia nigra]RUO86496.1 hypothetical protein D9R21_02680 [Spiroplasma endosymbiont of Megaselia nigra]